MAAVPRARHRARLLAQRAVRRARAPRRARDDRLVARPRHGAHARLRRSARGYHFTTLRDLPDCARHCASSSAPARELRRRHAGRLRLAGLGGASCSSARARTSRACSATLGQGRGGIDYEFLGAIAPSQRDIALPVLGSLDDLSTSSRVRRRRVDRHRRRDFDERGPARARRRGAPRRREGARRAEDDGAAHAARASTSPAGRAAFELRPPAFAGGLGDRSAAFDLVVSVRSSSSSACRVAADRARDQARPRAGRSSTATGASASASGSSGCSSSARWSPTPHEQQGARGGERGAGRAVQDPGRPARDARRPRSCAASRSTRCRRC